MKMFRGLQLVKKALLQGVPSPEGDGIKLDPVISGGVYLGNDTSVFQMTVDSGRYTHARAGRLWIVTSGRPDRQAASRLWQVNSRI